MGPIKHEQGSFGLQPHALAGGDLGKPRSRSGQSKNDSEKVAFPGEKPGVTSVMDGQVDTAGMFVFCGGWATAVCYNPCHSRPSLAKNAAVYRTHKTLFALACCLLMAGCHQPVHGPGPRSIAELLDTENEQWSIILLSGERIGWGMQSRRSCSRRVKGCW